MPHTIRFEQGVATHPSILDPRLREAVQQSVGIVAAVRKVTTNAKYVWHQVLWRAWCAEMKFMTG